MNENKNLHEEVEALKTQMASMHGWVRVKRNLITLAIVIGIPMALYAITKTYSFTAGTVAKASEINKNFDDLYAAVNEPGKAIQHIIVPLTTDLGPGADNTWSASLASITITPKYPSSKIIVSLSTVLSLNDDGGGDPHLEGHVRIVVNTTKITSKIRFRGNTANVDRGPISMIGEYSSGATNPITFGLQLYQRIDTTATLTNTLDYGPGMLMAVEIAQ